MLIAVGTKVRLIHTGEEGVVAALAGDDIVQILLDSGEEIPAFIGDLVRAEDEKNTRVKAKILQIPSAPPEKAPDLPEAHQQYTILKSMGIQIGFLPITRPDQSIEFFQIYLINDTKYKVLYTFDLQLSNKHRPKVNDQLAATSMVYLGDLPFVELNNAPSFVLEVWQVTTAGTGKRLHKTVRLKAKQFFNSLTTAPILNKPVYHYRVFESFDEPPKEEGLEDLKSYTKRKAGTMPQQKSSNFHLLNKNEIEELAAFKTEIDLHIEQLLSGPTTKMSTAEIIRIQMQHFEDFISKATQLGVDRVFVIHGLGKGRLRNEIATRLIQNPHVVTFKNEYHHRYGYGATEVIFIEE